MALNTDQVHKPVRKIRKVLKRISRPPAPEDVHDLRTNTRRFEATLTALSLNQKRTTRRILKDLAQLRKKAGKVRDMDVLTSYLASLDAEGDENCKIQLLEHVARKREQDATKLDKAISKQSSLRSRLKRTSTQLDRALGQSNLKKKAAVPMETAAKVTAATLALEYELARTPHLDRRNLHPFRLKVKELRNVLQMAKAGDQKLTDKLGEVKDLIGEWHDWEELLGIATKSLDHGPSCKLVQEIKKTGAAKYDRALAEAEDLRKKYLGTSRGKSGTGSRKLSNSAWESARAMAA